MDEIINLFHQLDLEYKFYDYSISCYYNKYRLSIWAETKLYVQLYYEYRVFIFDNYLIIEQLNNYMPFIKFIIQFDMDFIPIYIQKINTIILYDNQLEPNKKIIIAFENNIIINYSSSNFKKEHILTFD